MSYSSTSGRFLISFLALSILIFLFILYSNTRKITNSPDEEEFLDAAISDDLKKLKETFPKIRRVDVFPENWKCTALFFASKNVNLEAVQFLIERGADANGRGDCYSTPLIEAINEGSYEIVKLLIKRGADVNKKNRDKQNPLKAAIDNPILSAQFSNQIAKLLIESGADVNGEKESFYTSTPLFSASIKSDLELVRLLLNAGANVNAADNMGNSVLSALMSFEWAPEESDSIYKITELLLAANAEINSVDVEGNSVLTKAALNPSLPLKMMQLLLDRGADVNSINSTGDSALSLLIENYRLWHETKDLTRRKIKLLIKEGANIHLKNTKTGCTPLQLSIRSDIPEISKLLILGGAEINSNSECEIVSLSEAAFYDSAETVKLLLDHGSQEINTQKQNGTPLINAVQNGNFSLVKMLITQGANIDAQHTVEGCTALYYAARHGSFATTKYLLDQGAITETKEPCKNSILIAAVLSDSYSTVKLLLDYGLKDVNGQNDEGTPLTVAASYSSLSILRLLLERGAEINLQDNKGDTPLNALVKGANFNDNNDLKWNVIERAKFFIQHGAQVNLQNKEGVTPLLNSALRYPYDLTKLLIDKGADVNAKSDFGCSILLKAVSVKWIYSREDIWPEELNQQYRTAKLLISKGADVNAKNGDGYTVLMAAIWPGKTSAKLAKLLIDHGADVNAKSKNGLTPLQKAINENQLEVMHLLLEKGAKNESRGDSNLKWRL